MATAATLVLRLLHVIHLLAKFASRSLGDGSSSARQARVKRRQNLSSSRVKRPRTRRYSGHMANQSAPGGRILVVEDEDSISQPFAEALRRAGFEAVVTGTAAGALELAERGGAGPGDARPQPSPTATAATSAASCAAAPTCRS